MGEELEGIRAADASVILVDAKTGVEVGTELAWEYACREKIPRVFFINKFDDPQADFARVFQQLRDAFGIRVCPVLIPAKKDGQMVFVNLVEQMAYVYDERGKRTATWKEEEKAALEIYENGKKVDQSYLMSNEDAVDKIVKGVGKCGCAFTNTTVHHRF